MKNRKKKGLLWTSVGIIIFMFLPAIIAFSYQSVMSFNGVTIHEGNSTIFSLFWFSFITIPIGSIAFIVLGIRFLVKKIRS